VASNFLSQVFETNRFEERVMLRGVYFTSGTQEGNAAGPRDDLARAHLRAAAEPVARECGYG
jgi:type VI protein secretion system component VasK